MSAIIPNNVNSPEEGSRELLASKNILKSTYESVVAALNKKKKIILVTGNVKKGKTALIHAVCKDIADQNRIISLNGKDIPSLKPNETSPDTPQLNKIKDFILASTDLDDGLIVILDDADCLPIHFLSELISHTKKNSSSKHGLQLILTGNTEFKEQLLSIEEVNETDFTHYQIDSRYTEEILAFIKKKTFKISSNIKNLKFDSNALNALGEFSQANESILSVVLEWCAALVKKDQLSSVNLKTVARAANFAQQYSKDKNVHLESAYPPSHEVYKYINDRQHAKNISKPRTDKTAKNKPQNIAVEPPVVKDTTRPKIPTITSNIDTTKQALKQNYKENRHNDDSINVKLDASITSSEEVMPTKWVPAKKATTQNKISLPTTAGLLAALLFGFVFFINNRIVSDSAGEKLISEQPKEMHQQKNAVSESELEVIEAENVKNIITSNNTQIDTTKPSIIENPKVAPLVLGPLDDDLINEASLQNLANPKISELLALAEKQIESKKLSTPPGDNALETYQKVLKIYPNNTYATEGITNVHEKYLSWANYYFKRNNLERAKLFYKKALVITPDDISTIEQLRNIEKQQKAVTTLDNSNSNTVNLQNIPSSQDIQNLLAVANEKMLLIEQDINLNERNYNTYQEAQAAYLTVLKSQPENDSARRGISALKDYYVDWAEQQILNQNFNIALFLYGQALSLEPNNIQLSNRIEQIRELKTP